MDYTQMAIAIVAGVGGKDNISTVKHCVTRVRFVLKDESKVNLSELEAITGVMKVIKASGQYQVVVGNDRVEDVFKAVTEVTGLVGEQVKDKEAEAADRKKKGIFNTIMDYVISIFIPLMPIFIGGGIIKGLLTLAVNLGWLSADAGIYIIYYAVADGFMYFMPFIIAFLAAKKFNCNMVLAESIAAAMFYPSLNEALTSEAGLKFAGIPIPGPSEFGSGMYYANNVFAILMAVALLAFVEHKLRKGIKNKNLQTVLVPLVCLIIVTPITFVVFGPLSTYIGNGLAAGYQAIFNFSPVLGGAIIGCAWQVLIMFGMHWSFVPMVVSLFGATGKSSIDAMYSPGNMCMMAVPLGVALKTKDKTLRTTCISISASCLMGTVVEPALYGVALRFKKPFIIAIIGGALGGGLAGLFGAYSTGCVAFGIYTFALYMEAGLWRILLPVLISVIFTIVGVYLFGYNDKMLDGKPFEG